MQTYYGESSGFFNRLRKSMGKGRQHLIHRIMDAYMKNVYKGHKLQDGLEHVADRGLREGLEPGEAPSSDRATNSETAFARRGAPPT